MVLKSILHGQMTEKIASPCFLKKSISWPSIIEIHHEMAPFEAYIHIFYMGILIDVHLIQKKCQSN